MRVTRAAHGGARAALLDDLRAGWSYVSRFDPIRSSLLLLALVSTMGMPYTVLMPAIATNLLHGGPHTLGFLMTASGAGALVGALYLASRRSVLGLGRAMAVAAAMFGIGRTAFSFSQSLWLSLLL